MMSAGPINSWNPLWPYSPSPQLIRQILGIFFPRTTPATLLLSAVMIDSPIYYKYLPSCGRTRSALQFSGVEIVVVGLWLVNWTFYVKISLTEKVSAKQFYCSLLLSCFARETNVWLLGQLILNWQWKNSGILNILKKQWVVKNNYNIP